MTRIPRRRVTTGLVPRSSDFPIAATGCQSCRGSPIFCGELCSLPLDVPWREPHRAFTWPGLLVARAGLLRVQVFAGTEGGKHPMEQRESRQMAP